ncbi:hypothetical protein Cgig2_008850 [Carnegiea gigantea]|uniref:Uncharacterized protein n=1 Tax=Carnegiea gigantea TaxID=171969 RepID=A0A9Q1GJY7_9CARY|nr:hypothetical protein Cgig2_008850 [Carnegiea gigantea]
MAIHGGACENFIWARFKALKGELQHLVLSFSEDSVGEDGDSCASMAAFDRAKKVISIMRELRGLLSKPLPLLVSSSSAHQKMSRASGFLRSSRFVHGGIHGDRHKERTSIREPLPNRDPIPETLEMDKSRRPFDGTLEMELQHHEKSERGKLSSKGKTRNNKSPKSAQHSPTPTEVAKEPLNFGKKLGLSVIGDESPAIRRISRSLQKVEK